MRTTGDLEGQVRHLMAEKRDSGQLDTTEVRYMELHMQEVRLVLVYCTCRRFG